MCIRDRVKTDNGEVVYGEPVKVKGISNFSTTKSSTNSFGAKAVVDVYKRQHYYKIFKDGKTYLETNGSCFYHFLGRNAHEVGHIPHLQIPCGMS